MCSSDLEVGQGLRASGLKRSDAFITTKVLPSNIGPGDLQRSAQASLKRLALDDVDLLLIHWPNAAIPLEKSIEALCDAKRRGYAKNIGVANFTRGMVDESVTLAARHGEKLACNQCEYHPRLDQTPLIETCRRHGVAFVSYYPLAQGRYIDDPTLVKVAKAHGRTVAQVMLRWHVQQQGVAAIPKSSSPAHLKENISIFDFKLADEEMRAISAMARPGSRMVNPAGYAPKWDE